MSWTTITTAWESDDTLKVWGITENSPGSNLPVIGSSAGSASFSDDLSWLLREAINSIAPILSVLDKAFKRSMVDKSRDLDFNCWWTLDEDLYLRDCFYFKRDLCLTDDFYLD
jgi:hypothetical protein